MAVIPACYAVFRVGPDRDHATRSRTTTRDVESRDPHFRAREPPRSVASAPRTRRACARPLASLASRRFLPPAHRAPRASLGVVSCALVIVLPHANTRTAARSLAHRADDGPPTSDFARQTPDTGPRTPDLGCRTPDAGRRLPDLGRRTVQTGYIGNRVQGTGLVFPSSSSASSARPRGRLARAPRRAPPR